MHPSLLYSVMCELRPELVHFKPERVHRYADLIVRAVTPGLYEHKKAGTGLVPSDAIALSCRYLDGQFGRRGFSRLNEIAGCFASEKSWNMGKHLTRAYWLVNTGLNLTPFDEYFPV